jgi:hypothetical protein
MKDGLMPDDEKIYEAKLRRVARRQGLTLSKSRLRDPRAIGYGSFTLVDGNGMAVAYNDAGGLTLEEVERALRE